MATSNTSKPFERNALDEENHESKYQSAAVTENDGSNYGIFVVLGGFLVQITSMGTNAAWGVMQNYYEQYTFKEVPNAVVQLSLVGSLALSFMRLCGPAAQMLKPRIGHKGVLLTGCLCKSLGMIMAGFATQIYQLYICQGVLFGCGSSLMYYTSLSVAPQWFTKRKGLALGIIASGSGIGGLVMPFIMTAINSTLGPSWTYRILGFICLGLDLTACFLIKENPALRTPETEQQEKKSFSDTIDLGVLRNTNYILWIIGSDISILGYFIPLFFLPSYGRYVGLTEYQGGVLVSISSTFNFIGRILTGICADYLGHLNTNILFTMLAGLSCLLMWMFAYSYGTLIAFSLVFGLFCGAYFSLLVPITTAILGKERSPTGLSLLLIFNIAGVFGPNFNSLLEAQLLSQNPGGTYQHFLSYKIFAGVSYVVGALVCLILRFRLNKNWRVPV